MLSRIFPFQAMDISKLSGSQALLALFLALPWSPHPSSLRIIGFEGNFRSSICSTLVALHPASLGPGPMVPARGDPLTYPALQEPFHSTWPQGFRSRTNFTFSSLNRVLGKEKKLSLWGFSGKGGFLSCPEGWDRNGERIPQRGLPCLVLVKKTNQKLPVEGHGERSEPRTESMGRGHRLTIFSEVIFPVNIRPLRALGMEAGHIL